MDGVSEPQRPREADTIADVDRGPDEDRRPSTIGRYVIRDSVGMGGMGLVCEAHDPKLTRRIALKLLRNSADDEASTARRSRLFREAQSLARLSHPNVVTVYDVDVFEGQVYIAMEFVEGTTLREWLRAEPRTWKEILTKFILAGRGLAAAHQAGIIHRDFKPSNVLISKEGEVRVADFGVAKEREPTPGPKHDRAEAERADAEIDRRRQTTNSGEPVDATSEDALIEEIQSNVSRELTVAGRMVGTPAYMAPEQYMGLSVGPFTDQYAFCVSLYEALYERLPFEGTDRRDQLGKMTEAKLPAPPKDGPGRAAPSWLHKILVRGLRPHPSERWTSMEVLLAALERDPIKRIRRAAVLGVGVIGLGAGVFGVLYGLAEDEPVNECLSVRDEIADHWNAERRSEVQAAFRVSSKPYAGDAARRVTQTFDRWAESWGNARVGVCEATRVGEQSYALLDVRIDCLDQRTRELDAMVDLFVEADDAIVERSVSAAHALGDPRVCVTVKDTGEFGEHEALGEFAREQVDEMQADLNRAFALASAEKYEESAPLQARVVERARALPSRRTLARALYELAKSQLESGDIAAGEAALHEAVAIAAELGEVELEAQAWTRLMFYLGYEQQRFLEGHAWSLAASSALIRAGSPARLEAHYQGILGALELAEGQFDEAVEHYGKGLQLAREEHGEDHPTTIKMMINLGLSLARISSRMDEAEAVLLEAMSRSREVYGGAHPRLASVYYNLGQLYWISRQTDKAEVAFRQTYGIREQIGGPDAPSLAYPLHALAKIARQRGRHEEALADLQRVLAIQTKTKDEMSREVTGVLIDIAVTQQVLGRYDEARATFDRVSDIYAKMYPSGHLYVGGLEKRRCKLFIEAELWVEAVEACELAIELDERFEADPDILLEVYELLLEAEQGRGRTLTVERIAQKVEALRAEVEALKPEPKAEPTAKQPDEKD